MKRRKTEVKPESREDRHIRLLIESTPKGSAPGTNPRDDWRNAVAEAMAAPLTLTDKGGDVWELSQGKQRLAQFTDSAAPGLAGALFMILARHSNMMIMAAEALRLDRKRLQGHQKAAYAQRKRTEARRAEISRRIRAQIAKKESSTSYSKRWADEFKVSLSTIYRDIQACTEQLRPKR